jgi:hypothetical protein
MKCKPLRNWLTEAVARRQGGGDVADAGVAVGCFD